MNNLHNYSAISTKIRAMKSRFLSDKDYEALIESNNIKDSLNYLNQFTDYKYAFSQMDIESLHRTDIERILYLSRYDDFSKLYKFANQNQRCFLRIYLLRYEVEILKKIFRAYYSKSQSFINQGNVYLSRIIHFFKQYSDIDLEALLELLLQPYEDVSTFAINLCDKLKNTGYYHTLHRLLSSANFSILDYELFLDLTYFKEAWSIISKHFKGEDRAILKKCIGTDIDLANIAWIYRSKRYYSLDAAYIYSMLIPIHYKLSAAQIKALVSAAGMDEFFKLLSDSYYADRYSKQTDKFQRAAISIEALSQHILNITHKSSAKLNAYSIASLAGYLYAKELEIAHIIQIIESTKYGIAKEELKRRFFYVGTNEIS